MGDFLFNLLILVAWVFYPVYKVIVAYFHRRKHMREDGEYDMYWSGPKNWERAEKDSKIQILNNQFLKWGAISIACFIGWFITITALNVVLGG